MAGNFDFLHIKRRTAGSSNELSFDVLDHKSAEADAKSGKAPRLPKAPKASQGSYRGVTGTAAVSAQVEIEKRKNMRRAHRMRFRVVAVAAALVLIGAGVFTAVQFHESQADYRDRVLALVDRLSHADETMVMIDETMEDPFAAGSEDERDKISASMPALKTELNRISVDAQSLLDYPIGDGAEVVVGQVSEAAQARIDMMSAAAEAYQLVSESTAQVARANRVWNDVLNFDQLAREAVSIANKATTQEATSEALEKTNSASEGFSDALEELRDMHSAYDVDFTAQEGYLAKRLDALQREIETGEALLAGDRDAARRANEAYNAADAEAASLAESLPPSIGGLVEERFRALMVEHQLRYAEARNRAVTSDSVIREYIG